jgi:hypothetical protein
MNDVNSRPIDFLNETFPNGWEIRCWDDYYFIVVRVGCTCYDAKSTRLSAAITEASMEAFRDQQRSLQD